MTATRAKASRWGRERRREGAKDVRKEKTRNKDCTYADVHEE
jgi:hypothetical protein